MATFTKEELLRIAELSALRLEEKEIDPFVAGLQSVLSYAQQLEQCTTTHEQESVKTINVFRDDKAVLKDSSLILAHAPQIEESYFVVPAILE